MTAIAVMCALKASVLEIHTASSCGGNWYFSKK